ncbi:type II toxin-antitoxin system Phd/YefM family antitoxin [Candidatus Margulisiibacteriota bacterium]
MKRMAISLFKALALKALDEVAKSQEHIIITKRGYPIAEIIPYRAPHKKFELGKLSETLVEEKNIISPLSPSKWNACK